MMMDKQHNALLLDIIIPALKGYVQERNNGLKQVVVEDEKYYKGKFSYILGQTIRHWAIPDDNWHTSKAANLLWDAIVETNISDRKKRFYNVKIDKLRYKEPFITKKEVGGWIIPRFKGNVKDFQKIDTSFKLQGGKRYVFNDIFIAEHTTPVAEIMEALRQCYEAQGRNYKALIGEVRQILNKIHITQMLKIEDRRINDCQNRLELVRGGKSLYSYMLNVDSEEIFSQIKRKCYNTPAIEINDLVFSQKVEALKSKQWAGALTLNKEYKIAIIPNK